MLKSNDWADGAAAIAHVIKARIDTTSDAGEFTARISTGEVDRDGERMAPGALSASIAALKAKGRNLPVLGQSHEWGSPPPSSATSRPPTSVMTGPATSTSPATSTCQAKVA